MGLDQRPTARASEPSLRRRRTASRRGVRRGACQREGPSRDDEIPGDPPQMLLRRASLRLSVPSSPGMAGTRPVRREAVRIPGDFVDRLLRTAVTPAPAGARSVLASLCPG